MTALDEDGNEFGSPHSSNSLGAGHSIERSVIRHEYIASVTGDSEGRTVSERETTAGLDDLGELLLGFINDAQPDGGAPPEVEGRPLGKDELRRCNRKTSSRELENFIAARVEVAQGTAVKEVPVGGTR